MTHDEIEGYFEYWITLKLKDGESLYGYLQSTYYPEFFLAEHKNAMRGINMGRFFAPDEVESISRGEKISSEEFADIANRAVALNKGW